MSSRNASRQASSAPTASSLTASSPSGSQSSGLESGGSPGSSPDPSTASATTSPRTEAEWLTPTEAAALRGVTRATIYKAVEQGRLPHQIILGRIAVRAADVLAWAEAGTKPGRPKGIPMTAINKVRVAQAQRRRWDKSNG